MKIYPANKEHFKKLIPFAKRIMSICQDAGASPVIYGSFAQFYHTKDENMEVNDLDVIFPKKDLPEILRLLEKNKIKFTRCSPNDYSIIIKKGKLKVELDDVGVGNKILNERTLSKDIFNKIDFYGIEVRIITLKQLEEMYPAAYLEANKTKKKVGMRIKHLEKFLGRKLKGF